MLTDDEFKYFKQTDFEYFFKFTKTSDNFDELWRMKAIARETLKEWVIGASVKEYTAENCANACSELIENCIRYSLEDCESLVLINVKKKTITIETINKVEVGQEKIVFDFVEELNKSENLMNLYIDRIKKAATSKVSQLGLIKILMETNGTLKCLKNKLQMVHMMLTIEIE